MTNLGYQTMDVSLLKENNGTLRILMKDVLMDYLCDYSNTVYVDWLKNSTGTVTFKVQADMTFDYKLSLEDNKVQVTSRTIGGMKLSQD